MSTERVRVLVIEDDEAMRELLAEGLERMGYRVTTRASAGEISSDLESDVHDVVVTDLNLPGMSGLELCERIASNRPDVPVVVITAFGSLDSAIGAIRAGAYDFITKPFEIEALALTLDRAARYRSLKDEVKRLRSAVALVPRFDELLGESEAMLRLFDVIARVADSEATILISGETGSGKELVARALHRASRRADRPFVPVNCAAVPAELLESELFGHAKGAFTDARAERRGLFQRADGGTLFLDEVGDMPLSLQAKILRALEERAVRPVGSDAEAQFNARVISATNRDLEASVAEGRFRDDLFFRLNVIQIEVPPLRSRGGDVLLLAQNFVERFATRSGKNVTGISRQAAAKLLEYSWPGNVRELRNCMERAVAITRFEEVAVDDLPEKVRDYKRSHVIVASDDPSELVPLEEVERRYILRVLEAVQGQKTRASEVLGLDRKTLYRKLEAYGAGREGAQPQRGS